MTDRAFATPSTVAEQIADALADFAPPTTPAVTAEHITDATATGRTVLTGTPAAGRDALGVGSAATHPAADFATAAQGAAADTAVQPSAQALAISTAINNLVNGAPGTLDTLKEIADQLAADETAAGALTSAVNARLVKDQNLTDLPDKTAARTALELKQGATRDVGTTAGTVAAGNDTRIVGTDRGVWKPDTAYAAGDIVTKMGRRARALRDIPATRHFFTFDDWKWLTLPRLSRAPIVGYSPNGSINNGALSDGTVTGMNAYMPWRVGTTQVVFRTYVRVASSGQKFLQFGQNGPNSVASTLPAARARLSTSETDLTQTADVSSWSIGNRGYGPVELIAVEGTPGLVRARFPGFAGGSSAPNSFDITCTVQIGTGTITTLTFRGLTTTTMQPGQPWIESDPFYLPADNTTTTPTLAVLGDSLLWNQGPLLQAAVALGWSYLDLALTGEQAAAYPAIGTLRATLAAGVARIAAVGYGRNDMSNLYATSPASNTVANIEARRANVVTFARRMGAEIVLGVTIPPYTSSTDGWTTLAGQTPDPSDAPRLELNDRMRTNATGLFDGVIDLAAAAQDPTDPTRWRVDIVMTTDGKHYFASDTARKAIADKGQADMAPYAAA